MLPADPPADPGRDVFTSAQPSSDVVAGPITDARAIVGRDSVAERFAFPVLRGDADADALADRVVLVRNADA